MNGAIYVEDSKNSKIGKADTTYASIKASCPDTCALKGGKGCYSENSYAGIVISRLNEEAKDLTSIQVAKAEALAIDNSYSGGKIPIGRHLRLHTGGDSRSITSTRILNAAIGRWKTRSEDGKNICWSYTHGYKQIPRSEWSNVSILASVDSIKDVKIARKQGYSPAIVVAEFPALKTFTIDNCDVKWIPCPAQLKKEITCVSCKLCFNSDRLFKDNYGIAFAAHGVKQQQIKRRLKLLQ